MKDCIGEIEWMGLYHESPTQQGLAATSKYSTSLPIVGSDSRARPLQVDSDCIFIHCGIPFARSARYPI